ncbi:glycoside hydrolase family 127 protein [Bacillus sp. Au-Bac7]|uniref:glycoside hydrolase family 127 protein n=1 Tax=Bacillus sp. Au-Bac7 TaxID=2906458 RepID=UPI001E43FAF3|nr:beta-L-arabinofuranosidase domain-containing protein [Bacillus sp. Au-Bac7]MCE4050427.1 glycoside hydrolase family 127 protein [Bacillus sp. Au-Bac7]
MSNNVQADKSIHVNKVIINDQFWKRYADIVKTEMIPYQWEVLNDRADITIEKERNDQNIPSEKSHAIENFKIAAGLKEGRHYGWVFQDSDVYKWLEAVAYSIEKEHDPQLIELADGVIDLLALAQEKDGYLNTYFTIEAPERRFKRLAESHELYCAGHYMEAAVAYYNATKNEKALTIACKLADCIDASFGNEAGKIKGYDGHEEIELALAKLYELTKEKRYLNLCQFFLYERGQDTSFFERQWQEEAGENAVIGGMKHLPLSYYQAHKPILEQESAEGHAVRLVYLCAGMADATFLSKDEEMLQACKKLWKSITAKRMYITGGIGSTVHGEAFTSDYDLPNDTMYCETCASIGLIFFAQNMLKNEADSTYSDTLERALYNGVISGMALDGKHFFYVNPLESNPENSLKDPGKSHVKPTRPAWFGCACCPPNLARLLASIHKYLYSQKGDCLYANLYIANKAEIDWNGKQIEITQESNYPWEGEAKFQFQLEEPAEFGFCLRIPAWSKTYKVTVNGIEISDSLMNGYMVIRRTWETGDEICVTLDMSIQEWSANPHVKADLNKIAIQRGPIVYCMEEADNGKCLHLFRLPKNKQYHYRYDSELFGGAGLIDVTAEKRVVEQEWESQLYSQGMAELYEAASLTLIPYYAWANRSVGEMQVWLAKE